MVRSTCCTPAKPHFRAGVVRPRAQLRLVFVPAPRRLCFGCRAQGPTPAPPAQPPTPHAVPTLHASAQLVVVDVVVMDSSHKPVHGLKASDFASWKMARRRPSAASMNTASPPLPLCVRNHRRPLRYLHQQAPGPSRRSPPSTSSARSTTPTSDQAHRISNSSAISRRLSPARIRCPFGLTIHLCPSSPTNDPAVLRDLPHPYQPRRLSCPVRSPPASSRVLPTSSKIRKILSLPNWPMNLRQWVPSSKASSQVTAELHCGRR